MELTFRHRMEYPNGTASIDEIIENLRAQKKLLEQGSHVLDASLDDFGIDQIKIQVKSVVSGSLITDLAIVLFGEYQTQIENKVIDGIEGMFGIDVPEEAEFIVTLATLAAVYFVARYSYDTIRARKKDRPASTHITGDYNTVINILSDRINVPVSQIEDGLHEALPASKRRTLIKSVTRFLKPREDGRIAPIKVEGYGEISEETLREYPTDSELSEIDESKNLDLAGVVLDIRAMDKDKSSTGWAAIIVGDDRFKTRLPMDLYPTVDPASVAKKDRVTADITIEGERKPDGSFKAKRIHLLKIVDL
ncbi:MAG: hypothetical protein CML23_21825 [Rhizobiaceae bacterium]|nr:hypothetical protein [Rhizobiaceae bacterium]